MSAHTAMTDFVEVYAMGSLDRLESTAFEAHLAECRECDRKLARCEDALASLVPDTAAPAGMWSRISAAIGPVT